MAKKEKIPPEDVALCPEELPKNMVDWIRKTVLPKDRVLVYKKGNVRGTCYLCGRQVRATAERFTQDKYVRCPDCGEEVLCVYDGTRFHAEYVDNVAAAQMGADGQTLFFRVWHLRRDSTAQWRDIPAQLQEIARYAYRGELCTKWVKEEKGNAFMGKCCRYPLKEWVQYGKVTDLCDDGYVTFVESVEAAVAGTRWEYYQIPDYIARYQWNNPNRYIADCSRYPVMEFLKKGGYGQIIRDALTRPCRVTRNAIRWQAKRLNDAFKFPPRLLKAKPAGKWTLSDVLYANEFWAIIQQGSATEAEFAEAIKKPEPMRPPLSYLVDACKYDRLMRICKYLCKNNIFPHDYRDYIKECIQLKLELADKQVLYPPDFAAAHERTLQMVEYENNKAMHDKYKKRAKALEKYGWTSGDLLIRPAASPVELKNEGKALQHCVGGYVDRVARGECAIFFVRRTAAPEEPYYTLELRGKSVIQCRTLRNGSYTNDPQIKEFVERWVSEVVKKGGVKPAAKKSKTETTVITILQSTAKLQQIGG